MTIMTISNLDVYRILLVLSHMFGYDGVTSFRGNKVSQVNYTKTK
jgi:hypothetical protein